MATKKTVKTKRSKPAQKKPRRATSLRLKNDKIPTRAGGPLETTPENMLISDMTDDIPTRAGESTEKESE